MAKTVFTDGNPSLGILGTIITAALLDALNKHRHTGLDVDGAGTLDYAVSTGSANAYIVTLAPVLAACITGMPIVFKANFANTGAATLSVNGGAATALVNNFGAAIAAGDIAVGQLVVVIYDGTYFQVMGFLKSYASAPVGAEMMWPTGTAPAGWFEEAGTPLSMTTYEALYDVVGITYGKNTGTTCTFTASTDVVAAAGHGLLNGDVTMFSNSGGALPTGLSAATKYFVVNKNTNDFQIALTRGGAAVNFTSDGTGTSKFHNQFKLDDVRGRFPRFWDHAAAVDPDRALIVAMAPPAIMSEQSRRKGLRRTRTQRYLPLIPGRLWLVALATGHAIRHPSIQAQPAAIKPWWLT